MNRCSLFSFFWLSVRINFARTKTNDIAGHDQHWDVETDSFNNSNMITEVLIGFRKDISPSRDRSSSLLFSSDGLERKGWRRKKTDEHNTSRRDSLSWTSSFFLSLFVFFFFYYSLSLSSNRWLRSYAHIASARRDPFHVRVFFVSLFRPIHRQLPDHLMFN